MSTCMGTMCLDQKLSIFAISPTTVPYTCIDSLFTESGFMAV